MVDLPNPKLSIPACLASLATPAPIKNPRGLLVATPSAPGALGAASRQSAPLAPLPKGGSAPRARCVSSLGGVRDPNLPLPSVLVPENQKHRGGSAPRPLARRVVVLVAPLSPEVSRAPFVGALVFGS